MAKRSKRVAVDEAEPEVPPDATAAPFASARAHEVIALVLPLLPVAPRVRCAAVCRAWRDAAAAPSVWAELDFREDDTLPGRAYARPSVDTLALVALCRRAGASLRALHLDYEASVFRLSAASVIYALQTSGAGAVLRDLTLPAPENTPFEYDGFRLDQLLLTAAQVFALKAACPALRVAACGVFCQSDADAAIAAAALPGPLVLCFARSWCDRAPDDASASVVPAHWLAPSVASMLIMSDSGEELGHPTNAEVVRLGEALRAAPASSLRHLDVFSGDMSDTGAEALAAALRSETCALQTLFVNSLTDVCALTLASALATNSSLRNLRLRGPGLLGAATATALGAALGQNTTLRVLELEAALDDAAMASLGRAISESSTLKGLCLLNLHPMLSEVGLHAFSAVLRPEARCRLEALKLTVRRSVQHDAAALLCSAAAEPGAAPALKALSIECAGPHDEAAPLGAAGAWWLESVCAMLRANTTVQELSLKDLFDDDAALVALAGALRENSTLRELSLCCWDDYVVTVNRGMVALAKALTPPSRAASSLELLDLTNMRVRPAGSRALCDMLRENTVLRVLDLPRASQKGACDDDDDAFVAVAPLCAALRVNRTLLQLSLGSDGSTDATIALGRALEHNTGLRRLDVGGVSLDNGGAAALAAGLQRNRRLYDLIMRVKRLDRSELAVFAGALSRTRTLTRLDFSDASGVFPAAAEALGRAVRANDCPSALVMLSMRGFRAACAAAAAGRLPFETAVLPSL
jgi:hypothetical protein